MFKVLFCFLVCYAQGMAYTQKPYEILHHIKDIKEMLYNADKDTLIVMNIDGVVIEPRDLWGRAQSFKITREVFDEYRQKHGKEKADRLYALLLQAPSLIDPNMHKYLDDLFEKHKSVLALTALDARPIGDLRNPLEWRIKQMKKLGVFFQFPKYVNKGVRSWEGPWGKAAYRKGVLCCGKQPKGEALFHFLKIAHWMPKRIIFIDDREEQVQNMQMCCEKNKVACKCYHYVPSRYMDDPVVDREVFRLQVKTLDETGQYVTDEEASAQDVLKLSGAVNK